MGDPQLFVSAFENADKDTLQKMMNMVNDLLKQGEADEEAAVKAHGEAKAKNDDDKEILATATAEFKKAASDLAKAKATEIYLKGLTATQYWALEAAKKELARATNRHQSAVDYHTATEGRVAEEKKALEDAKSLLADTKSGGRRLLSATEADPDAVDKVIKEIDALIAAGEKDVSDAVYYVNAMAAIKKTAVDREKKARDAFEKTVNELNKASALVKKNTKIFNAKKKVLATARANELESRGKLHSATEWMNIEVTRVADEKKTLLEVIELLEKML